MIHANITLYRELVKARIDDRLFGAFIEHLGRAIYGGIYEPGHPSADEDGFRTDVLAMVRELGVPIIRYPGGNFVSALHWEDSIGPVENRPRKPDLAWRSIEPNTFGLNEFLRWSKKAGSDVMMAMNLGTRGIDDAINLVDYCNHPSGTWWSDLRRSHGIPEPYGIKVWCLGNEMDGPWQIGFKTAHDYGKLAAGVGKALKLFDPGLELVACGSSGPGMQTFPEWEATVLELCYEHVDYVSLHTYARKHGNDSPGFLAESVNLDRYIRTVINTADYVQAKVRSKKQLMLSVDEWNVWYHSLDEDTHIKPWSTGPRLLHDIYTLEDALVVGCFLIVLMRHADRVRMACLAQLVNTIAPIMTENNGPAWKQTIFYPFFHASLYGRGEVLTTIIESPVYDNPGLGDVPFLEAVAVFKQEEKELTLFCVNRSPDEELVLKAKIKGFGECRFREHIVLSHQDPGAVNSRNTPARVVPGTIKTTRIENNSLESVLPPLSWNVIRLKLK
ncbi:MAG: alpha-N-arabinofuranosidase [Spirochaetales bacterium]|nr:alpha-N-arabinofuranosidase [Spirochaetales bacterium]